MSDRTRRRSTGRAAVWCLAFVAAASLLLAGSAAADNQYAVVQDDECYDIEPLGDGEQTAEAFYDYRNSEPGDQYSSYGTTHLQENQTSQVFLYDGSDGTSLVVLHDELDENANGGGGAASMAFSGLPTRGSWSVQDDNYDGASDTWEVGETSSSVDWVWAAGRTDGGVYSGFDRYDYDAVTIEPAFNDAAGHYDEADGEVETWQVRDADGTTHELALDRSLSIQRWACGTSPPAADLTVDPSEATTGQEVTFDASDSTADGDIVEYRWDLTGDGEIDERTTDPVVTHTYETAGSKETSVVVEDEHGNTDRATTVVTVDGDGEFQGCLTIEEPGRYTLVGDIVDSEAETCIHVRSDDVVVEGGGHTVDGVGASGTNGVLVDGDGVVSNVTVRNLTVTDWNIGVHYRDTEGGTVRNIQADSTRYGIWTVSSTDHTIAGSTARNNDIGFAHLESDRVRLTDSAAIDNSFGFHFERNSQQATIQDSRAVDNGWDYYMHDFTEPADHTVERLELSSGTISFTGGKGVALRGVNDPPTAADGHADVDSYVEWGRSGSNPQLSLTAHYDDAAASDVNESSLRMWRREDGEWATVADPNYVATDTNRVTAEEIDLPDERARIVFAPLGEPADETDDGSDDTNNDEEQDGPTAHASVPTSATVDEAIEVDGTDSSGDREIESYEWTFGDGGSATGETATHTYTSAGTYTVTLTVTDSAGETDTTEVSITVEEADDGTSGSGSSGSTGGGGTGGTAVSPTDDTDDEEETAADDEAASDAAIVLDSFQVEDAVAGEDFTIRATFRNDGDDQAERTVRFHQDNETITTLDLVLEAGATETVTVTHRVDEPGEIELGVDDDHRTVSIEEPVAAFEVTDISVETDDDGSVTVTAVVTNDGTAEGTYTAELQLDERAVASDDVTVPAGEQTTVSFSHEVDEPGVYLAAVGDVETEFEVEPDDDHEGTADADGAGFGAVAAILAVLAIVGLSRRFITRRA